MELYACGKNEAGNLNLPAVCVRYHILGSNPCDHNNHCQTSEDPFHCPEMVTRLTRVLDADNIRIILYNTNCTILNESGKLRTFGSDYPSSGLTESIQLQSRALEIMQVERFEGSVPQVIAFMNDGSFWAKAENEADFSRSGPYAGREVLHLARGTSMISVVPKSQPRTAVLLESSHRPFIHDDSSNDKEPYDSCGEFIDSFDLPAPLHQLTGNLRSFTALTADGEVYTWSSTAPPKKKMQSSAQPTAAFTEQTQSTKDKEEEDGPDMSDFLSDLPASPPPKPPSPSSPQPTKVPLPPTTKISSNISTTAAIASSRLYLWLDPSEATSWKHYPTIPSLGTPTAPALQSILTPSGQPLDITDVSVGKSHIIALAVDGSLWSIGRGWHGELGIGEKMLELQIEEPEGANYDQEDAVEFASTWQRMDTEGLLKEGWEWASVRAGEEISFAVARKK